MRSKSLLASNIWLISLHFPFKVHILQIFPLKILNFATLKNNFVEGFKNLARYRAKNIFIRNYQNNYVEEFKRWWQYCNKF